MKEKEYINLTDLQKLRIAIIILYDIEPENSSVIEKHKFNKMRRQLVKWQDDLTDNFVNIIMEE